MKLQLKNEAHAHVETMLTMLLLCSMVGYCHSSMMMLGPHGGHRVRAMSSGQEQGSCAYWCPKGLTKMSNPDFVPVPNGCGSYGFTVKLRTIPDAIDCCNQHDLCYKTCGISKSKCDFQLKSCMKQKCREYRSQGAGFFKYYGCKMTMYGAYGAVKMFGCLAFKKDQRRACKCVPQGRSTLISSFTQA